MRTSCARLVAWPWAIRAASRYTGSPSMRPSMGVLLGALDLAHRWQVPHIVVMAENLLVEMVPRMTLL